MEMNAQQRIRNELKNARGRSLGMRQETETVETAATETVGMTGSPLRTVPHYVGTMPGLILDRRAQYALGN